MEFKSGFLVLFVCTLFVLLLITVLDSTLKEENIKPAYVYEYSLLDNNENKLLNLNNFKYLIQPECNATLATWIVTSYAGDPSARSALRRAYSNEELQSLGIRRVFLLGTLNETAERITRVTQNALINESQRFRDILQGNFVESYRNLTYKHLMGLKWAVNNCKNIQYVVKMDDDIIVNLYDMLAMLQNGTIKNDSITGYVLRNMVPVREPKNKWFVTRDEIGANVYPDFLSGWLYIATPETIRNLVRESQASENYFWIDDVFITGILRERLHIKAQSINHLYATDYRYLNCCIRGKEKRLKCDFMIGPNGGDTELQVIFRDFAELCHATCSMRPKELSVINTCVAPYEVRNLQRGNAQIQPISIV